jgi:hypothetical protein
MIPLSNEWFHLSHNVVRGRREIKKLTALQSRNKIQLSEDRTAEDHFGAGIQREVHL